MNEELFEHISTLSPLTMSSSFRVTRKYYQTKPMCVSSSPGKSRLNIPILSAAMDTVTEARLGDCIGARRRHGNYPSQYATRSPGCRSRKGQAFAVGHDCRADQPFPRCISSAVPKRSCPLITLAAYRSPMKGKTSRHPHEPRYPLCRS